ncbi:MAG: hypothetical protein IPG49_02800 [Proteobacteria bacterium]|jgi:hypothetical protein|nr:hypothetical protein [Pseudomonadota bacterium]
MHWQSLVVALIVALAVLFALWRLPGSATRLRYVGWMKRLSGGHGPLARLALRLEARTMRGQSACSGCSASADHRRP